MECDRCGDWIDDIPVRIGDEIYHGDCAEKVLEADAEYEAVLATYREQPVTGFFSVIEKEDRKARKAGMIERTRELEKAE